MSYGQDWRLEQVKSWRTKNETLQTLMWILFLLIALGLVGYYIDLQLTKRERLINSVSFGCELPLRLTDPSMPPEADPIPDADDVVGLVQWHKDRKNQYRAALVDSNNDKAEIRSKCNQ